MKKINGATIDALFLTFIRLVTLLNSMVTYKLMAVYFSLEEYGTYSSAILVSSVITSATILGLTDGINYFYAKQRNLENGKKYAHTIIQIEIIVGLIAGFVLILSRNQIANYYNNASVSKLIPWVAFIPLFTNLSHILQVLFVTAQKIKAIAIRSLVISIFKIVAVIIACLLTKDIKTVVIVSFVLDFGSVIYMFVYCKKQIFSIDPRKAELKLVPTILKYSIPMAAYIIINALLKNIDKLVVGKLGNAEMLAVYTIASKELPFDLLTASFLTVLVPYITRFIGADDYENASTTYSKYIQITYLLTWMIAGGALVCSKDLMILLYDEKYLSGVGIFCLYIVVDMMKFASVSLIFSVTNRAKELLCYSGISIVLNIILNIIFFKTMGIIGPAVSTVLITLALSSVMLFRSAKLLNTTVRKLIQYKQMILIAFECAIFGVLASILRIYIAKIGMSSLLSFVIVYAVYILPLVIINFRKILSLLRGINKVKMV